MTHPQEQGASAARTTGKPPVEILYTNWRGETAVRYIVPGGDDPESPNPWFGPTEWHPQPQYLLSAWDLEKGAYRDFACADIKAWGQAAVAAALASPADSAEMTAGEDLREILLRAKWIGQRTTAEDYSARVVFDTQEGAYDAYRALVAVRDATPAPAATPGVPDSVREALEFYAYGRDIGLENSAKAKEALKDLDGLAEPATPCVPDSLRALSEAATQGELNTGVKIGEWGNTICAGPTWTPIARFERQEDAEFFAAAGTHVRTLIAAQPAGQAGDAGVPVEVRKAIAFAAEAEGTHNGCAARRYAGLRCLQWVETLLSPQADKRTEPLALRAVVEVYPDRTDTRLTFGDHIRPEPGVKAVEQAIAALTAEYEARGGCPVVGRQPAGQAGDAGEDARTVLTEACKPWEHYTGEPPDDGSPLSGVFVAGMSHTERLLAKLLDVTHYEGGDGSEDFDNDATQTLRNILTGAGLWDADENRAVKPAPDSTRTGAAETEAEPWKTLRKIAELRFAEDACEPFDEALDLADAALAGRPEAPSDAGWRSQAADEIDAIADLWSGDVRSYAKTIAAILRAEEPEQLQPADAETKRQVQRAWDRFKVGTSTPPSDPAPSGQAEG